MIYLASPYSDPKPSTMWKRYRATRAAFDMLTVNGAHVFSPVVLGHEMSQRSQTLKHRSHAWWMEWCITFLRRSTSLFVLTIEDWDLSKGVGIEVRLAADMGIPIFSCDILDECEPDITGRMIRKHFGAKEVKRPILLLT
jgi:hypothetical protein